jgi:hypothetical protein
MYTCGIIVDSICSRRKAPPHRRAFTSMYFFFSILDIPSTYSRRYDKTTIPSMYTRVVMPCIVQYVLSESAVICTPERAYTPMPDSVPAISPMKNLVRSSSVPAIYEKKYAHSTIGNAIHSAKMRKWKMYIERILYVEYVDSSMGKL